MLDHAVVSFVAPLAVAFLVVENSALLSTRLLKTNKSQWPLPVASVTPCATFFNTQANRIDSHYSTIT